MKYLPCLFSDLKIGFHMVADGDIPGLEFRRMYFYNGRDRSFTVKGEVTLKIQGKEHCLMPYAVLISVSTLELI